MAKKRRPKRQKFKQGAGAKPSAPSSRDADDDADGDDADEATGASADIDSTTADTATTATTATADTAAAAAAADIASDVDKRDVDNRDASDNRDAGKRDGDKADADKLDASGDKRDADKRDANAGKRGGDKADADKLDASGDKRDADKRDANAGKRDGDKTGKRDGDKTDADKLDANAGKRDGDKTDADKLDASGDKRDADKRDANAGKRDGDKADAKRARDKAIDDLAADAKQGKKAKKAAKLPEMIVRREGPKVPPVRDPVFWFGFEVAWAKLAASRFVIFTLLAFDALLQISHAPRYGAGGFNVANLSFLDELAPGRVGFGTCQLVLAYGFILIAFGVATRVLIPLCAAIYAWVYFGSQLDSYQHHYLIALVLFVASFVPWQRPADAEPATRVRTWALRLLLVQLAIMYVWAAISKMNLAWVDGRTLAMQMTGGIGTVIAKTIGFKVMAVLVIATELALAVTVWLRPAWIIAAPLGIAFHLGIVFTGLEIGLFAYLMLGIYALVLPDQVWISIMSGPLDAIGKRLAKPGWAMWITGLLLSILVAFFVRFEGAFVIAMALCIVPLAIAIYAVARGRKKPVLAVGLAHVIAIGLWLFVDRTSSVTVDYFRFWGGSQRRIGTPAEAEHAYRRLTEVAPDEEGGHYQLGKLLIKRGANDEGLLHLHEAQRLAPAKSRAFVEEARFLQQQNKIPEAIEKAKQATYADPSDTTARNLLDTLTGKGKAKAKPADTPDTPDDND